MARYGGFSINQKFFEELDALLNDLKKTDERFPIVMDKMCELYAATTMSFAQKYSMGPVDPSAGRRGYVESIGPVRTLYRSGGRLTGALHSRSMKQNAKGRFAPKSEWHGRIGAWTIPVRRISGDYFRGWYIERVRFNVWRMSNTSREAWYIEMGVNHEGTGLTGTSGVRYRIKRPIFKLSLVRAVQFAKATRFDIKSLQAIMAAQLSGKSFEDIEKVSLQPRTFYGVNVDYLQ